MANRKIRRAAGKPDPVATAVAHMAAGRSAEALQHLQDILAKDPNHPLALLNIGILAYRAGQFDLAQDFFARAGDADPALAEAPYNQGLARQALGQPDAAAAALRRATALAPRFATAWAALGAVLETLGPSQEALDALDKAAALDPSSAGAHMNLGNALRVRGRLSQAEAAGRRAAELAPGFALAHRNLALTLRDQGRLDEALESLDRALSLDPALAEAQSERLFWLHYHPGLPAAETAQAHRRWGSGFPAAPRPAASARRPDERLRIGYVSGELHAHPVGYFLRRILEHHDRSAFEAICYANGARHDDMSRQLKAAAGGWRSIHGLPDEAAAAMIREDGVDILVDLSGHTAHGRLRLFALRPAPIQAAWLGYVGSTGLPAMDYALFDPITTPPGAEGLFTETLLRLPQGRFCYAPPDDAPEPGPPPSTLGRPFTFGSFNDILKLGPPVIALWSRVLHACPGSRLLLKWPSFADPGVRARVLGAFAAHGVDAGRIELRGFSPHREMLAQYRDMDVALDPIPFCGGLTTCEALWMGVPVVTLPQEGPASRQSLAFLAALDLAGLAASSKDGYVAIAQALAADPHRLAELKRDLRGRMAASALCDGAGFTRALEAAFTEMRRRAPA